MGPRPAAPAEVTLEDAARELASHLDRALRRVIGAGDARPQERFSRSEIAVVDTLGAEGSLAMGGVARVVRLPVSTATRIVDRLVARELVQRERLEEDRRLVRVGLAPKGQAFYRAALKRRVSALRRLLQGLTEGERATLLRLFRKIADSITDETAP